MNKFHIIQLQKYCVHRYIGTQCLLHIDYMVLEWHLLRAWAIYIQYMLTKRLQISRRRHTSNVNQVYHIIIVVSTNQQSSLLRLP